MADKKRKLKLYKALTERGLVESEPKAKALIMAGKVVVNDQRADKAGPLVTDKCQIRVKRDEKFVSRGGLKLESALDDFGLREDCNDIIALDVGSSTGGFTDCLLQHGAKKVYALDVGSNQLAWSLRNDPRVESMEQTDIRKVDGLIDEQISMVVADISFNSLSFLLPHIMDAVPKAGVRFLLLVKPQFELDASQIPDGGVVADDAARQVALEKVISAVKEQGFDEVASKDCQLAGRTGNREIFIYFSN